MIVTFTSQPYLKGHRMSCPLRSSDSPYFFDVVVSPSHSEVLRKSFSFKEQEQEQEKIDEVCFSINSFGTTYGNYNFVYKLIVSGPQPS